MGLFFLRNKKIFRLFSLILTVYAIVGSCLPVAAKEIEKPRELYAIAACLMDAQSGRVLFEKNAMEHRANASTTKIMTLILTLENCDLDETVVVSQRAARQPDVQLNINTGEEYRLEDLCYSLMLESHNDSAVAIAEHVGGSVESFAVRMNDKAKEIGCKNTYFLTPNGLDANDERDFHGTSAHDLALMMSYCIMKSPKRDEFLTISRTQEYSFHDLSGKRSFSCRNHNSFLQMMEGALSGKTGFTCDAGYCYVGALKKDERTFVIALLGCGWPNNKGYKWKDARKLFSYGLDAYQYKVCDEPLHTYSCEVNNGTDPSGNPFQTPVITLREEAHDPIRLLLREDEFFSVEEDIIQQVDAPVFFGMKLGSVHYYLNDLSGEKILLYSSPVYAQCDVKEKRLDNYFRFLVKVFLPL
ncbi:MAG: D-alanyl-D-alanine carboxypeptidase [bacterium]|nr:D-alanyl-D-alanine carboxypeptidase [bacterium]